jgi:hypothetical protein
MDDDRLMIEALNAEGLCCTQIIIQMALDKRGSVNPELMDAAAALCVGLKTGNNCGALTGAAMILGMADRRLATVTVPELVEWFRSEYGDLDCFTIAGEHGELRQELCLEIVQESYMKAVEILNRYDLIF